MVMHRMQQQMHPDSSAHMNDAHKMANQNRSSPQHKPKTEEHERGTLGKIGSLCSKFENKEQHVTKGLKDVASEKSSPLQIREEEVDADESEYKRNNRKSASPINDNKGDRSVPTIPSPFSLETEKRALSGGKPAGRRSASVNTSGSPTDSSNPISPNDSKMNQSAPPSVSRKSFQYESAKSQDDEDACSIASTNTSVKSSKTRSCVPSAPIFRCPERADRRKEFYAKLEEKNQAMEAERLQKEAEAKEAEEARLKELRKSMTFKANPVPSFYYEGPPPKVELKKIPPTRAKSPKFSRRNSCDGAILTAICSEEKTHCTKAHHHSPSRRNSIGSSLEAEKSRGSGKFSSKDGAGSKTCENAKTAPLKVSNRRHSDHGSESVAKDVTVHS